MSVAEALDAFKQAGAHLVSREAEDDGATAPREFKEDVPIESQAANLDVKREYQSDPGLDNVLTVVVAGPLTYALLKEGFQLSTATSAGAAVLLSVCLYNGYMGFVAVKTRKLIARTGEFIPE